MLYYIILYLASRKHSLTSDYVYKIQVLHNKTFSSPNYLIGGNN